MTDNARPEPRKPEPQSLPQKWREHAQWLRRSGNTFTAARIEDCASDLENAAVRPASAPSLEWAQSLVYREGAERYIQQAAQDLLDDLAEADRIGCDVDAWGDALHERVIANIELRIRQAIEHIENYSDRCDHCGGPLNEPNNRCAGHPREHASLEPNHDNRDSRLGDHRVDTSRRAGDAHADAEKQVAASAPSLECIGCHVANKPLVGYTIERKPGPFCADCWKALKAHVVDVEAASAPSRPLEEIEQACREMEVIAKSKRDIARLTDEPDYEANGMFAVIAHVRETLERLRVLVPGGDPQEQSKS